jgi:hypothetical protein
MRSPLEMLEGRFDHALLTTYSFSLRFFEEWVLRSLWACEIRNVVVFVDPRQLGCALEDPAPSAAGRSYHLVATHAAHRAFHPKVMLLTGSEGSRLCVSSANLTGDGQLRNLEAAIAFDSHLDGHVGPMHDAGDMFRALALDAPSHAAAAVQAALASLPVLDDSALASFRLIHNLNRPLIDAFPLEGDVVVTAPYVDAAGNAATRLLARGSLRIIVDGEEFAAPESFFDGGWTVDAQSFEARLHGKAYWVQSGERRWLMIGSPNLSGSALLRRASHGNVEAAIVVEDNRNVVLYPPPGQPWSSEESVVAAAAERFAEQPGEEQDSGLSSSPTSFNAWEDERLIRVDALPEGTLLEWWTGHRWSSLGLVSDGCVAVGDLEQRPTRLRAVLPSGGFAVAIVAQPTRLRSRLRARLDGSQAGAAAHLPLDLDTVRALEGVLSELYALSEIVAEARKGGSQVIRDRSAETTAPSGLTEWMPRHPDEDPRVPTLYRSAWRGDPDALLALVSRVLRLDRHLVSHEDQVASEELEVDELDWVKGDEPTAPAPEPEPEPPIPTTREALEKYRRAFARLLKRGISFVAQDDDATLASFAFQYLLRLTEDLGKHSVEVDGRLMPLSEPAVLRDFTHELLDRYLSRGEPDPACLPTARAHLAACLRDRERFTRLQREQLDRLAFRWAADLLEPQDGPTPSETDVGMGLLEAGTWLSPFAQRTRWKDIEQHASEVLADVRLEHSPFPTLYGTASFERRLSSPAWRLIAFAAPAGQATPDPFAVVVCNTDDESPAMFHAVACGPELGVLQEAMLRRNDRRWVVYSYRCRDRTTIEMAGRTGPVDLERAAPTEDFANLEEAPPPLHEVAEFVERRAAATN